MGRFVDNEYRLTAAASRLVARLARDAAARERETDALVSARLILAEPRIEFGRQVFEERTDFIEQRVRVARAINLNLNRATDTGREAVTKYAERAEQRHCDPRGAYVARLDDDAGLAVLEAAEYPANQLALLGP